MIESKTSIEQPVNRLNQLLYTLAKAYLQRGQYLEAYDKLRQLLRLDPDNAEIMVDATVAALGLNEASSEALGLYEKVLAQNPSARALKFNITDLLVQRRVASPFAIALCEEVVEQAPANETQIRHFLKQFYEANGMIDKALAEERRALFASRDRKAIRQYLEKLWWEGNFADAHQALQAVPRVNGAQQELLRESAVTFAYELLAQRAVHNELHALDAMLSTMPQLAPAQSALDWRDAMLLRWSLQHADVKSWLQPRPNGQAARGSSLQDMIRTANLDAEQFASAHRPFDIQQELLNVLAPVKDTDLETEPHEPHWQGLLLAQIVAVGGSTVPERLQNLLGTHLQQLPESATRLTGAVVLNLAKNPLIQVEAMIDFILSLEDYNGAVAEAERVTLIAVAQSAKASPLSGPDPTLAMVVEGSHWLRYAERAITPDTGAGLFLAQLDSELIAALKNNGVTAMATPAVRLLPHLDREYQEIVWRNPILQLKEGQSYEFGRYAIKQRLQKHGSYSTYLATDTHLDRPVIIKIMLPQEATKYQNENLREPLLQRLRAVGRLSHPYLCYFHDMGEHEDMLYYTREYVVGQNLSELTIPAEQRDGDILMLLQKIVRALKFAHDKGVVYLNLKPSNIWLSDAQELKITDFRIPGFTEDGASTNVLYPSHWRYQSPELLLGETVDERSEVYSLGVLAYELIAGKHPYNTSGPINTPRDLLGLRIAPLSEVEKTHHRAWNDFVMRALHTEASRRYQNLEEMEMELRNIQGEMLERALNAGR
ncbi:MAG: protein kinase domain-containing protein [bacterium]